MYRILRKKNQIIAVRVRDECDRGTLTRIDDAIDENVTWNQTVIVLVHLAEQICQT